MKKEVKTRLQNLLEGKNEKRLTLKEGKIKRSMDSAIAYTEEQVLNLSDQLIELLDNIVETENITELLNNYISIKQQKDNWVETKKYLEELKDYLNSSEDETK